MKLVSKSESKSRGERKGRCEGFRGISYRRYKFALPHKGMLETRHGAKDWTNEWQKAIFTDFEMASDRKGAKWQDVALNKDRDSCAPKLPCLSPRTLIDWLVKWRSLAGIDPTEISSLESLGNRSLCHWAELVTILRGINAMQSDRASFLAPWRSDGSDVRVMDSPAAQLQPQSLVDFWWAMVAEVNGGCSYPPWGNYAFDTVLYVRYKEITKVVFATHGGTVMTIAFYCESNIGGESDWIILLDSIQRGRSIREDWRCCNQPVTIF